MIFFLKIVKKIFLNLPLWALALIGRLLAFILSLNLRKKRIAYLNLKVAFPERKYSNLRYILKKSYYNFSLSLIEAFVPERFYRQIELKGQDQLKNPGICVGIHSGSWELINLFFAQNYKFAILANPQKNKKLDYFLNQIRSSQGLKVCLDPKALIRCIKNNYYIGMVVDHGSEAGADLVVFFGQVIPAPKGAAFLAKKFKRKVYLFFSRRIGTFRHQLELLDVVDPMLKNQNELLQHFSHIYQKQLTQYPHEYLWAHKRFKHKKNREVLILSDGKPGHIKQSLALLSILRENPDYQVNDKIIVINYRNYFMRVVANFFAGFCPNFSPSQIRALKILLDNQSYRQLASTFSDIVISTGNFTAPIVKIFSSSIGARSGVILRTNLSPAKFDLAIVPEHDRFYSSQAVKIKGALTYPDNLEEKKKNCQSFFSLGSKKKISVFIGGPVSDQAEFIRQLKYFIKQLKKFSQENDYRLLVSASRRTPPEAEEYIQEELGSFVFTEALVIASKKNYDFVFEGFVLSSDFVLCSSESISMITEIVSLQKPCVCVFLESEDDKRKVFLNSIKNEVSFLRYPFRIITEGLKISKMCDKNRKIIKKAANKLFSLR